MPLKGLTWFRLKEHIRKFGAIYIAGIAIAVILTNLLYTTTRPRTPIEYEVKIYMADAYAEIEPLDDLAAEALAYGQSIDETLQEVCFEPILYTDPETDMNSPILLMTRMSAGEGDIYLANAKAMENMARSEFYEPLDDYLAEGWLEELDGELYTHTSEDGVTSVAGIGIDNCNGLSNKLAMNNHGAYLVVAPNSTNLETSMAVAEFIMTNLLEDVDASADSEEPAA